MTITISPLRTVPVPIHMREEVDALLLTISRHSYRLEADLVTKDTHMGTSRELGVAIGYCAK